MASVGADMTTNPDVVEVPCDSLSADTLRAVVEQFITGLHRFRGSAAGIAVDRWSHPCLW